MWTNISNWFKKLAYEEYELTVWFKDKEEISEFIILFDLNGNKSELPVWNLMNGPIADAIYHTGQIVSYRRMSGNPINPKVNVMMGKTGE